MKLIRFGEAGVEKPGIIDVNGGLRDVSEFASDYDTEFFATDGPARLRQWTGERGDNVPKVEGSPRLGAPIARPGKIICIGLNYSDHAEESGMELPAEPVIFFKASSAYCGPNDGLILPRGGDKTDWEVELAFVIGRTAKYVGEGEALNHVAGYCIHNDYSERAFQLERCGQWVKGKSCDTFAPLGPFLATPDELPNVGNLPMWLKVNGETKQNGSTSKMVFQVPHLVHYLSQFMTLDPGDVISTGTPPGVGLGCDPPQYLKAGDIVELGIEGLGEQRQEVLPAK